jgi:hypothetical protein
LISSNSKLGAEKQQVFLKSVIRQKDNVSPVGQKIAVEACSRTPSMGRRQEKNFNGTLGHSKYLCRLKNLGSLI